MADNRYEAGTGAYEGLVYDGINKKYMDIEEALAHILNILNRLENRLL